MLGWIEYLRSQDVDQSAVEEMNKDLTHLMKIVDRFSKIGSETPLPRPTSTKSWANRSCISASASRAT
ncbi:hypothetical protein [Alistipes sp.]|uniref:hypothetical protein n=1 Tax=Alistipes sp. TaxID=1872444 RepID=UPI0013290B7C|nr:hypothetical protein [Alistipes sp.]MUU02974.1 hypothetical protein [Alistipes sp.]